MVAFADSYCTQKEKWKMEKKGEKKKNPKICLKLDLGQSLVRQMNINLLPKKLSISVIFSLDK